MRVLPTFEYLRCDYQIKSAQVHSLYVKLPGLHTRRKLNPSVFMLLCCVRLISRWQPPMTAAGLCPGPPAIALCVSTLRAGFQRNWPWC